MEISTKLFSPSLFYDAESIDWLNELRKSIIWQVSALS